MRLPHDAALAVDLGFAGRFARTCYKMVNGSEPSPSEHAQDVFVWRNLFLKRTLRGEKGFYIDSGANRPVTGSNTWFFDRCLGWEGLCIEPNPSYWSELRAERSCTVVPECITDRDGQVVQLQRMGPLSRIVGGPSRFTTNTTCNSLHTMLARVGRSRVDFWSLDVEGHEMAVLQAGDWQQSVHAILVEDNKLDVRALDALLASKGYGVRARFLVDSLFVRGAQAGDTGDSRADPSGNRCDCDPRRNRPGTWCPPVTRQRNL
eukprot:6162044-Prymnesium_polylepis.1